MTTKLRVTRVLTYVYEIEYNENNFKDMTLEEAIELEEDTDEAAEVLVEHLSNAENPNIVTTVDVITEQ